MPRQYQCLDFVFTIKEHKKKCKVTDQGKNKIVMALEMQTFYNLATSFAAIISSSSYQDQRSLLVLEANFLFLKRLLGAVFCISIQKIVIKILTFKSLSFNFMNFQWSVNNEGELAERNIYFLH